MPWEIEVHSVNNFTPNHHNQLKFIQTFFFLVFAMKLNVIYYISLYRIFNFTTSSVTYKISGFDNILKNWYTYLEHKS